MIASAPSEVASSPPRVTAPAAAPTALVIALVALSVGYLATIGTLCALIIILHDGEATISTVQALQNIMYGSLTCLAFVATGHQLIGRFFSGGKNGT